MLDGLKTYYSIFWLLYQTGKEGSEKCNKLSLILFATLNSVLAQN